MICKFCGNEISENQKFCRGCGASYEEAVDVIKGEVVDPVIAEAPIPEEAFAEIPEIEEPKAETVFETVYESDNSNEMFGESDTRPLRKKPHGLISFLCFLLMFITFFLEIILGSFITLKFTTSSGAVKKAVSDLDFTSIEIDVDGKQQTFAEAILSEVTNDDVKEEDINKLIEEFQGEEYFAGVITDLTDYMFNGGEAPKLDADELTDVIKDNNDVIEEITGERLSDADIDEFRKSADDFVENFNENVVEMDAVKDINKFTVSFSLNIIIAITCGTILFFILILVLCYKLNGSGVYRVFKAFSVPTFMSAFLFLVIVIVVPKFVENVTTGDGADLVIRLVDSFANFPLYAGIELAVTFVVSKILHIVFKVIYNKNTRA